MALISWPSYLAAVRKPPSLLLRDRCAASIALHGGRAGCGIVLRDLDGFHPGGQRTQPFTIQTSGVPRSIPRRPASPAFVTPRDVERLRCAAAAGISAIF